MSTKTTQADVDAFNKKMRDEHRLKVNVDYAIALKYGDAHLVCSLVYFDLLAAGGISFATVNTYH